MEALFVILDLLLIAKDLESAELVEVSSRQSILAQRGQQVLVTIEDP